MVPSPVFIAVLEVRVVLTVLVVADVERSHGVPVCHEGDVAAGALPTALHESRYPLGEVYR